MFLNVIAFRKNDGSMLNFTRAGLIRCNGSVIGEFNRWDSDILRSIKGPVKVLKNEIRNKEYRIVFEEKSWKLYRYAEFGDRSVNILKAKGHLCLTRFNEEPRNRFFKSK